MAKVYITFILLILLPVLILAQYDNIKFDHLTVDDGLPSNRIHCILQDSRGFMWFGTKNGLNKFDGYKFTNYKPDSKIPNSIGHIFCRSILEDYNGDLWIGTYGGGLHKFDREKEIFINYYNEKDNPFSLSNNFVTSICQSPADSGKILWIGTRWGGLNKFDLNTEKFIHYQNIILDSSNININNIFNMYFDREGTLWIGTAGSGLINYDPKTDNFVRYSKNPLDENSLSNDQITSIYQDKLDNIWIGTEGGLNKFDKNQKKITRYLNKINDKNCLSNNNVTSIHQDKSGKLWIGTYNGLNILNPESEKFKRIHSNPNNFHSLSDDHILSVYQDPYGILWIGTLTGGINKYNPNTKDFKHFRITLDNSGKSNINFIRTIQEDIINKNVLWLGTSGAGLIKYNRNNNKFIHYYSQNLPVFTTSIYQNPQTPNALWIGTWGRGLIKINKNNKQISEKVFWSKNPIYKDAYHISTIYEIKNGVILLGTSLGLYQFDCSTQKYSSFIHNPDDPTSISHHYVTSICRDSSGQFWIGTYGGGLNKSNLNSDSTETDLKNNEVKFFHYKNNPDNPHSISNNTITFVYEDHNNNLWIGTQGGGLNKLVTNNTNNFNPSSEKFIHYSEKDGLPSNVLLGVLEDDNGKLWLSTNKGISQFDPIKETFRNYGPQDGLQSNEFIRFSTYKNQTGEMFFGGVNGFNTFYPESIKVNQNIPKIAITDFQIFNISVKPGENSPLKKSLSESEKIILSHDQAVFSFEFAALEYTIPGKNKYAYKMEGVDPDWVYTDASRRFATYTNLDPGEYIFKVKGSNNDGIWNEEGTSVKIIILPPWWKTNLAYTFYLLLFGFIVILVWRFQSNRLKIKHELELEHVQAEKLKEVDEIKSRFFTNISHEFRTPLTLIKGPAKLIIEQTKDTVIKDNAILINRNSEKLSRLVTQLLDLSKIEAGRMKLKTSRVNIVSILKELALSFASYAERKKITLNVSSVEEQIMVYLDTDKMEKIINNILSNAFKYTAEKGKICVQVSQSKKSVEIKISDTGIGISKDRISNIFDRFYQADQNHLNEQQGTGIGLALTKELIMLHKGDIDVESKEGEGTTFKIKFLLGKNHLKPDEIFETKQEEDKIIFEHTVPENIIAEENINSGLLIETDLSAKKSEKLLLLIVEDNTDVRQYIRGFLEKEYKIMEAIDGEDGYNKSISQIPDLIVSDVMMPKIDGIELTDKLKNDERTSHIPIILLTAKATSKDKIEGYETGADDYIMKPFDAQELKVRIKNLIDQRKKLRQHFLKEGVFELENKNISSIDKKFLKRAIKIITEHLSDTSFGVESFAVELAIGRTSLYKKIMALVGEPPGDLIKRIRLSSAARLIKNKTGNISEIALEVGFNNPAYFSECFKKQFGVTPSKCQSNFNNH